MSHPCQRHYLRGVVLPDVVGKVVVAVGKKEVRLAQCGVVLDRGLVQRRSLCVRLTTVGLVRLREASGRAQLSRSCGLT